MAILDINEIREILPHRYPFLLVDRIVEMEADRIVGIKNVTVNEPFFTGHFPDFPVMPGVLIVEAMAQTAGVLVLKSIPDRAEQAGAAGGRRERAVPQAGGARRSTAHGDEDDQAQGQRGQDGGRATVDGVVVAEAEVMCKLADKEEKPPAEGGPDRCRSIRPPSWIPRARIAEAPKSARTASSERKSKSARAPA